MAAHRPTPKTPAEPGTTASSGAEVKALLEEIYAKFGIPRNPALDADAATLPVLEMRRAQQQLAFLALCYKRAAAESTLTSVSNQPAGMVRSLRDRGFIFRPHPQNGVNHWFPDQDGVACREITGYGPNHVIKRRPTRYEQTLVEKACDALVQAIESYNRPSSSYGTEAFTILLCNAWELAAKARLIDHYSGDISEILAGGAPEKTIDLQSAIGRLRSHDLIDKVVGENVKAMQRIRNDFIHSMMTPSAELDNEIRAFGSAAVENFISLAHSWFNIDLHERYRLAALPLLPRTPEPHKIRPGKDAAARLLNILRNIRTEHDGSTSSFRVASEYRIDLVKGNERRTHAKVRMTNDPDAPAVRLDDDRWLLEHYPWEYSRDLIPACKERYSDFRVDKRFHAIRRDIEDREDADQYRKIRLLDPGREKSGKKTRYSHAILKLLDEHYERRAGGAESPE